MATTPPSAQIILERPGRCRIVLPNGRTYFSTPAAVGMSLLAATTAEENAAADARTIQWHDLLASHGVAVGTSGTRVVSCVVIPPTARTIPWAGARGEGRRAEYAVTFPHLLAIVVMRGSRFQRAGLWCINPAVLPGLTIHTPAACLRAFPYSNVYAGRGEICWGTIRHDDIRDTNDFLDRFFHSGFNGDLYEAAGIGTDLQFPELAAATPVLPAPTAWNQTLASALQTVLRTA